VLQPAGKSTIACGLLTAALGVFVMLETPGMFGPGRPGDGPPWIGVLAGLIFCAGGIAVAIQSLPVAKPRPDGGLSPDAPLWVRNIVLTLILFAVAGLAAIAFCIAFGSGPRSFRLVGTFIGEGWIDETIGRAVFALGATLTCIIFVAFAMDGARRMMRRKQDRSPG
jgi:hypothetical protein